MKYVQFLPKAYVESKLHDAEKDAILISITEPGEADVIPCVPLRAVLRLKFHDVDVSASENSDSAFTLFDVQMARQIENFVDQFSEASHIIVHCHAGISRSAAVALYLGDKLQIPVFNTSAKVNASQYGIYNKHVFRVLLSQHYASPEES